MGRSVPAPHGRIDELAGQDSPGPTIRRAQLLSATLRGPLLDTLNRIYELDSVVDVNLSGKSITEPKLPRFDVTYGKKLGSGAFGTVWQAADRLLERSIAVKFLTSTAESLDENALLREARNLAKIAHPNLVTVYAAAWLRHPDNGLVAPAIIMELLTGSELQKWRERQQARHDVLKVASGILTGLEAMHQAGLHHGDLHAENVLVLTDGTAKLIDWRYQDTFLAQSTAHRHELVEIDQRRAIDLVLNLLERQGVAEALKMRRNPDFASVRGAIATLIEPRRLEREPDQATLRSAFETYQCIVHESTRDGMFAREQQTISLLDITRIRGGRADLVDVFLGGRWLEIEGDFDAFKKLWERAKETSAGDR